MRQLGVDGIGWNDLGAVEDDEAAYEVLELAHVPGPAVAHHAIEGSAAESLDPQTLVPGGLEEVPGQIRDVFGAPGKGRQPQRHDVEPVEEVLAEQAASN